MTRDILLHAFGSAVMLILSAWFVLYLIGVTG